VAGAACAKSNNSQGYSYSVDWWSLGVVAFELVTGRRPFDIHSDTTAAECIEMMLNADTSELLPSTWSPEFLRFVQGLLCTKPERRICSVAQMKKQRLMANINFSSLEKKRVPPPFVPSKEGLNCDPTFELEEMIVETKPLHKKKKRLLRQQTLVTQKLLEQNARSQRDEASHV
jgi:serine/threonine kinase 32